MDYLLKKRHVSPIWWVYIANSLLSFHYALIVFVNSAYLGKFLSYQSISLVFLVASVITLFIFAVLPKIISRIGIFTVVFASVVAEMLAILSLAIGFDSTSIILSFLVHHIAVSLIYFSFDIYLESITTNEMTTGSMRGFFLASANLMYIVAPFLVGYLINFEGYRLVYLISGSILFPLLLVISLQLRHTKIAYNKKDHIWYGLQQLRKNREAFLSIFSQLALQLFYAVMTIYLSIYLIQSIGFTWDRLGALFTIMLLPFLLFEILVGKLADSHYGEKEFMLAGFVVMASMLVAITLPTEPVFWLWALLLFISRVGASFVEVTSETHFFRQIKDRDGSLISLFRMTRPVAFILVGLIGAFMFNYLAFTWIWLILAGIVLLGCFSVFPMKDSR